MSEPNQARHRTRPSDFRSIRFAEFVGLPALRPRRRAGSVRLIRSAGAVMRTLSLIQFGALLAFVLCGCSSTSTAVKRPAKSEWQKDAGYRELLRARQNSASQLLQGERRKLDNGRTTLEAVLSAAARLRDARLDLAAEPETVIREEHLALMREMEKQVKSAMGFPRPDLEELARYWRLSAEVDLLRAQKAATDP
jgi:hypothetical protein